MITLGRYHSAIVTEDELLLTTGANGSGQLGIGEDKRGLPYLGTREDVSEFTPVLDVPVIMAAVGNEHTAVITPRGELLVAGSNFKAQLGMPNNQDQIRFVKPPYEAKSELILVRCGAATTIILSIYGEVLMCGVNIVAVGLGEQAPMFTYCNTLLGVTNISNIWIVVINGQELVIYADDSNTLWSSSATRYPEKIAEAVNVRSVANIDEDIIILDQQGQVFSISDLVVPLFKDVDQMCSSVDGTSISLLIDGQALLVESDYSAKVIADDIILMGFNGRGFIGLTESQKYIASGDNNVGQLGAPPDELLELF